MTSMTETKTFVLGEVQLQLCSFETVHSSSFFFNAMVSLRAKYSAAIYPDIIWALAYS